MKSSVKYVCLIVLCVVIIMIFLCYYNDRGILTNGMRQNQKNQEDHCLVHAEAQEISRNYYKLACNLDKNSKDQHTWSIALTYYLKAYELNPRAEPLIRIAQHYYSVHDYALTYLFASKAVEIPMPIDQDIEADLYKYIRYDLLAISAWYIGEFEKGEEAARQVLNNYPNDKRLKDNLQFYVDRRNY